MSQKLLVVFVVATLIVGSVWTCKGATTYTVGDNSGWDISSDLGTWPLDKKFQPSDALVFQYSSPDTVNEATKESFDGCNTTNVLKTYSNGNTTVTLDRPGPWYFIPGNRLYCLGGMKLALNVERDGAASSPAGAPQPQTDPSSKTDLPSSTPRNALVSSLLCILTALLSFVLSI